MRLQLWQSASVGALAALAVLLAPLGARADDPKFTSTDRPKDDAKPAGWKAEVKGGLLFLTGNSQSLSVTVAARASYDAVWQKYSFLGDYTYSSATTFAPPTTTVTSLDQLQRVDGLSARLWDLGFRFDHTSSTTTPSGRRPSTACCCWGPTTRPERSSPATRNSVPARSS